MLEGDHSAPIALPDGKILSAAEDTSHHASISSENLRELLDLSDNGELVVWPEGYSASTVRRLLSVSSSSST